VDTRSDIYALGVLLYELLTGRTPFDAKELLAAGLDEMRHMIQQEEPPRPSTRLSTLLEEERTLAASHRQTEPTELIRLLRGDLDWIAMKCLEKDRARRYPTANGLAADIQRHLNNEPVVARPPSRSYLLQKLVLRNKGTVAALSAVAAALIAGLTTSTFLYFDEVKVRQAMSHEADRARSAEADARERLRVAYLAQAKAERWSQHAGRRFEGLDLLQKAAAIRPSPELRNEAIACMALSDVRVIKEWNAYPTNGAFGSFDANYDRYVFGDAQGVVHVARVADGTEIGQFAGYEPPYDPLEFSPDGRFLFVACGPGHTRVEVVDLKRKEVFLRLPQLKCRAMDFSGDSRLVAVSYGQPSSNYPVRIFDLTLRKEVLSFDHGSLPFFIRFHPKQSNFLLTSDETPTVRTWDVEGGRVAQSFLHPAGVQGICWHPDGQILATACEDGKVRLWEAASGKELAALPGHQAEAVFVTFSHDGEFLASRGWDGMLRLWNPSSQRELVDRPAPGYVYPFSRAGNQLGVNVQPGRMALLDVASGLGYRVLGSDLARGEKTFCCAFSSNGRMMVSTHGTKVRCWDVLTGLAIAEMAKPAWEHFAVLLPDGQRLFLGTSEGVEEWSLTQSSPPQFRCERRGLGPVAPQAYIMTLSQDGRQLAVSAKAELQIIDTQSGLKTADLKPPYAQVFGTLSPDGQSAVTWGRASTNVQIWDVLSSAVAKELPVHGCNHAAFSPNNRWLVVGNVMEFRVWDVATWQSRYAITNEASGFYGYSAFSPDSRMLAVGISRTAVRLVEASSGRDLATLEAPERLVINWIAFNPDGTQLAVALLTGPIQLWDLRLIRQQLASMKLDWEMPPYPRKKTNPPPGPLVAPMQSPGTTTNAAMPR
jgi:WD40 repeat protein